MKKKDLLKVFPSLSKRGIQVLPDELVVCWYPSSGVSADLNDNFCGYVALRHWQEQPSKLKPNLFIFSDIEEFEIHPEAKILFNEVDPIIQFLSNDLQINYDLIDDSQRLTAEQEMTMIENLFDIGMLNEDDWITKFEEAKSISELELIKMEIKLLFDSGKFDREKIIQNRKLAEESNLLDVDSGLIKNLTLINHLDSLFLLVQTSNKNLNEQFIQGGLEIPLLTINRPWDPFVLNNGIEIEKLGIQEFIAGHSYVSSLIFGEEFKKYPDFVFQTLRNRDSSLEDLANLYSCLGN